MNAYIVYVNMGEIVKEFNLSDDASELIESRALDLICKKGYSRDALEKELKMNPSDLKVRIRKELSKYREVVINER